LPIITFDHDVTVHLNGEDNVVHMGDDLVGYGFPFIDMASGGSVQGMAAAMEKVSTELPADVKVIPGHGDISKLDAVRAFA
jgi:cyclase